MKTAAIGLLSVLVASLAYLGLTNKRVFPKDSPLYVSHHVEYIPRVPPIGPASPQSRYEREHLRLLATRLDNTVPLVTVSHWPPVEQGW